MISCNILKYSLRKCFFLATSKTWTQALDLGLGPGPWTRTLKNLEPGKFGPRKTWTLKNLNPEKSGLWKTWTMKNTGNSWMQKKRLENHMV